MIRPACKHQSLHVSAAVGSVISLQKDRLMDAPNGEAPMAPMTLRVGSGKQMVESGCCKTWFGNLSSQPPSGGKSG